MTEIQNTDETYMREALKQAKKALALGEVPIGCVIVHEGKIMESLFGGDFPTFELFLWEHCLLQKPE